MGLVQQDEATEEEQEKQEEVAVLFPLSYHFLRPSVALDGTDHLLGWEAYTETFLHKAKCISAGVYHTGWRATAGDLRQLQELVGIRRSW